MRSTKPCAACCRYPVPVLLGDFINTVECTPLALSIFRHGLMVFLLNGVVGGIFGKNKITV